MATGDAGVLGAGADPTSLAGKVLRMDEFGAPAPAGESADSSAPPAPSATKTASTTPVPVVPADPLSAIYAHGLVDPTGLCASSAGVGVVDRFGAADVLARVTAGADLGATPAIWSFPVVDGGAVDCAQNEIVLAATSLDQELVTTLTLGPDGGFTGQPSNSRRAPTAGCCPWKPAPRACSGPPPPTGTATATPSRATTWWSSSPPAAVASGDGRD